MLGETIKCLLCDKELKTINPRHLHKCSGTTVTEYRRRFPDAPLRCEETKRKIRQYWKEHPDELVARRKKVSSSCRQFNQDNPEA